MRQSCDRTVTSTCKAEEIASKHLQLLQLATFQVPELEQDTTEHEAPEKERCKLSSKPALPIKPRLLISAGTTSLAGSL